MELLHAAGAYRTEKRAAVLISSKACQNTDALVHRSTIMIAFYFIFKEEGFRNLLVLFLLSP